MQNLNEPFATGPIARVREGMPVVDADGKEVGRVDYVQMGDPEAATAPEPRSTNLVTRAAEVFLPGEREPDVPEPLRSRLRRTGYIKIDGPDLLDTDRYVSSERVKEVSDDRVRLSVRREELAVED